MAAMPPPPPAASHAEVMSRLDALAAQEDTSTPLKPGQAVRIRNPPAGDTFAKFRDRDGVIEYELPGEDDSWVVAVLRRKTARVGPCGKNAGERLRVHTRSG